MIRKSVKRFSETCSNKKVERDDDSKISHRALADAEGSGTASRKKVVTLSLASHGAEASAHEFAAALVVSFDCVGGAGRPARAGCDLSVCGQAADVAAN